MEKGFSLDIYRQDNPKGYLNGIFWKSGDLNPSRWSARSGTPGPCQLRGVMQERRHGLDAWRKQQEGRGGC
tara:strand:- start:356 stop:568 length:213 start_codon:yes stop_codon:yes gene_type:complete